MPGDDEGEPVLASISLWVRRRAAPFYRFLLGMLLGCEAPPFFVQITVSVEKPLSGLASHNINPGDNSDSTLGNTNSNTVARGAASASAGDTQAPLQLHALETGLNFLLREALPAQQALAPHPAPSAATGAPGGNHSRTLDPRQDPSSYYEAEAQWRAPGASPGPQGVAQADDRWSFGEARGGDAVQGGAPVPPPHHGRGTAGAARRAGAPRGHPEAVTSGLNGRQGESMTANSGSSGNRGDQELVTLSRTAGRGPRHARGLPEGSTRLGGTWSSGPESPFPESYDRDRPLSGGTRSAGEAVIGAGASATAWTGVDNEGPYGGLAHLSDAQEVRESWDLEASTGLGPGATSASAGVEGAGTGTGGEGGTSGGPGPGHVVFDESLLPTLRINALEHYAVPVFERSAFSAAPVGGSTGLGSGPHPVSGSGAGEGMSARYAPGTSGGGEVALSQGEKAQGCREEEEEQSGSSSAAPTAPSLTPTSVPFSPAPPAPSTAATSPTHSFPASPSAPVAGATPLASPSAAPAAPVSPTSSAPSAALPASATSSVEPASARRGTRAAETAGGAGAGEGASGAGGLQGGGTAGGGGGGYNAGTGPVSGADALLGLGLPRPGQGTAETRGPPATPLPSQPEAGPEAYQWCTRSVLLVVLEVVPPEEDTALRPLALARSLLSPAADAASCLAQFVQPPSGGHGTGAEPGSATGPAQGGATGDGAPRACLPWALRQQLLAEAFPGAKVAVSSVVSGNGNWFLIILAIGVAGSKRDIDLS